MAAVEPNSSESRIEVEVRPVQTLIERRDFLLALTAAEAMLVEVPENRDVLYLLAVSQRYLGRITERAPNACPVRGHTSGLRPPVPGARPLRSRRAN
jgi:hypothetical protein